MKKERRVKTKFRIRKKIMGTQKRPRLSLYKSLTSLNVQLIDDKEEKTLCSVLMREGKNIASAKKLGKLVAEEAKKKSIKQIVFDRNAYRYHGVVKALGESAREHGLVF